MMFNHMYGSPFPTINPKVRYKTALERAGFDVNFEAKLSQNNNMERRNVSMGSLQPVPRLHNNNIGQTRVNSLPGMGKGRGEPTPPPVPTASVGPQEKPMKSSIEHNNQDAYYHPVSKQQYNTGLNGTDAASVGNTSREELHGNQQKSFQTQTPLSPPHVYSTFTNSTPASQPANSENSWDTKKHSLFNFEVSNSGGENMNPIEKSFMMLTRNDTSSSIDIPISPSNSIHTNDSLHSSSNSTPTRGDLSTSAKEDESPVNTARSTSLTFDDNESLNFQPCSELHVNLATTNASRQSSSETKSIMNETSVPALKITTHFAEDDVPQEKSIHSIQKTTTEPDSASFYDDEEVKSLNFSQSAAHHSVTSTRSNEQTNYNSPGSSSSENISTPIPGTNLQVEKLIAQLDDVSYSKNADLDTSLLAATAVNSLNTNSHLDFLSLSVGRSSSGSISSSRFKKSSAYLSGYPEAKTNISEQTIAVDDGSDSTSFKLGDTPIFYKFKHPLPHPFPQSEESLLKHPGFERLQLSHKESTEHLQQKGNEQMKPQDESNLKPKEEHMHTNNLFGINNVSEPKFPPGQGPCRLCCAEVSGKRIFSKKDNELSGQWHRDCFRCLTCNVRFNKKIPCYILDDKPYCQQHYHEENYSICQICNGFIEGECLENDRTERFHAHCLTCFLCRTPISSDYYIYNGELPLCGKHDMDALLKDGLTENKNKDGRHNTVSKRRTRLINFAQT